MACEKCWGAEFPGCPNCEDNESHEDAGYSEEDILKVVDACFHAFSSSNRGEAREMALRIIKTL